MYNTIYNHQYIHIYKKHYIQIFLSYKQKNTYSYICKT